MPLILWVEKVQEIKVVPITATKHGNQTCASEQKVQKVNNSLVPTVSTVLYSVCLNETVVF